MIGAGMRPGVKLPISCMCHFSHGRPERAAGESIVAIREIVGYLEPIFGLSMGKSGDDSIRNRYYGNREPRKQAGTGHIWPAPSLSLVLARPACDFPSLLRNNVY